jgi:hypothetical protein
MKRQSYFWDNWLKSTPKNRSEARVSEILGPKSLAKFFKGLVSGVTDWSYHGRGEDSFVLTFTLQVADPRPEGAPAEWLPPNRIRILERKLRGVLAKVEDSGYLSFSVSSVDIGDFDFDNPLTPYTVTLRGVANHPEDVPQADFWVPQPV